MDDTARHYEALELKPGASIEEITKAYQDLIQVWQPNQFDNNPQLKTKVHTRLTEINIAFGKLIAFYESNKNGSSAYAQTTTAFNTHPHHSNATTGTININVKAAFPNPQSIDSQQHKPKTTLANVSEDVYSESPRRWVRFWARLFDMNLHALIFGFVIGIFLPYSLITSLRDNILSSLFVIFFCAFVLEALILGSFGITLGKWLLNIKVLDSNGQKLGFTKAVQRCMLVWSAGYAFGIPIVCLLTMFNASCSLESAGKTFWDRTLELHILHGRIDATRGILFSVLFIMLLLIIYSLEKGRL